MRRMRWMLCLWPGLAQLWIAGSWSALAAALVAGVLLNLALLTTFVWTEMAEGPVRGGLWALVALGWTSYTIIGAGWIRRQRRLKLRCASTDTFGDALDHYLKGNWFETERVLGDLLRQNVRDVDARLMLATLLRHTGRFSEAAEQLDLLAKLDGSEKWQQEIGRERWLLSRRPAHGETNENQTDADGLEASAGQNAVEKATTVAPAA